MRCTNLPGRNAACRARLHDIAPLCLEGRIAGLSGLVVDIEQHTSIEDSFALLRATLDPA